MSTTMSVKSAPKDAKDQTMQETAADIGASFVPVLGQMQAGRDFVRAKREENPLGMGLSIASVVPGIGALTNCLPRTVLNTLYAISNIPPR